MPISEIDARQLIDRDSSHWAELLISFNRLPIACALGATLSLSLPGFNLWWLAWFVIAPYLVLLKSSRNQWEAILLGFGFGISYHLVATIWYFGLTAKLGSDLFNWFPFFSVGLVWLVKAAHAALLNAVFAWFVYALPCRPGYLPNAERPFVPYLLAVPSIWIFIHWVIGPTWTFAPVPIDQLAYSQSGNIAFIQIAKLGGAQAIEFLIVCVNAALAACIVELPKAGQRMVERVDLLSPRFGSIFDLSLVLLIVIVSCLWGEREIKLTHERQMRSAVPNHEYYAPFCPVALLQGDVRMSEAVANQSANGLDCYVHLSSNMSSEPNVNMIFLPQDLLDLSRETERFLLATLVKTARTKKIEIVTGAVENFQGRAFETVRFLRTKAAPQTYVQSKNLDLFDLWPVVLPSGQLAETLTTMSSGKALNDEKQELFTSMWGSFASTISAEVVYPRLAARAVRQGASLLVTVCDLTPFSNSLITKELLSAAVFRAIENERFLVFSNNSGLSAVIDPCGIVQAEALNGHPGAIVDTVQFLYRKTPFTKMWWL